MYKNVVHGLWSSNEHWKSFWPSHFSPMPEMIILVGKTMLSGWWFQPTPLKNDGVKVRWDDSSIPNINGKS